MLYKIIELDGAVGIYYVVSDLDIGYPFKSSYYLDIHIRSEPMC